MAITPSGSAPSTAGMAPMSGTPASAGGGRTQRLLESRGIRTAGADLSAPANTASKQALQTLRETGTVTIGGKTYTTERKTGGSFSEKPVSWPSQGQTAVDSVDFEKNSRYISTANGREPKMNMFTGRYTETGYDDILYDAINGDETARSRLLNTDTIRRYDLDKLTDSMVQTFNYLYKTKGSDTAYDYLDAEAEQQYSGIDTAVYGVLQGTGLTSASAAIGAGIAKLTGDEEMAQRNRDWYSRVAQDADTAKEQHPVLYGAGSVGGTLALMGGMGGALGAAEGALASGVQIGGRTVALQMAPLLQNVVNGGLTFLAKDAVQNAGMAATGLMSGKDYAAAVGKAGVQGMAGGLAGGLVSSGMAEVLRRTGMMTPFMEFVRQSASGFASASANIGTGYALSEEKPSNEQIATDLVTAFLFSVLQSGISTYATTRTAKANMEAALNKVQSDYSAMSQNAGNMTPEARATQAENILAYTQSLRNSLNSRYLAGQQSVVNEMNQALDGIEAGLQSYINGFRAASAATQAPGNLLGAAATGLAAPSGAEQQLRQQVQEAVEQGLTQYQGGAQPAQWAGHTQDLTGVLPILGAEAVQGGKKETARQGAAIVADTSLFEPAILKNFNTARKKLLDFAKAYFPAQVVNQETGKEIGISRTGLDKFLSGNIPYEKYASGFHIPELIARAHKVGEADNYHPETAGSIPTFEYYDSAIQINGQPYNAHIRVKNTLIGDKYYGHTISEIEDIKIEPPTRTSDQKTPAVQPEKTGGSADIIAQREGTVNVEPLSLPALTEDVNGGQRAAGAAPGVEIAAGAANIENGGLNDGGSEQIAEGQPAPAAEGDALPDGRQGRLSGTGTGEQTGELATGAARAVRPAEQGRAAVGRQNRGKYLRSAKVSSLELGLPNGTETPSVSVVEETDWDEGLRATAERVYQETGLPVTYTLGTIPVRDTSGVVRSVRGVFTPDRIFIQADNLRLTTDQIADHEIFHNKAFQTPGLIRDVELQIMERYSAEEFGQVVSTYVQKLRGVVDLAENATPDEIDAAMQIIKEEIFADAYAGINAFSAHAERFQGTVEATLEERGIGRGQQNAAATDRTTGPPTQRYSYGGRNANRADSVSLARAEELENQGADAETIRQETGWHRGADGLWRFEMDDSGMVYDKRGNLQGAVDRQWAMEDLEAAQADLFDNITDEQAEQVRKYNRARLAGETEAAQQLYAELAASEFGEAFTIYVDALQRANELKNASRGGTLADYIQHAELFANYPQLRNVKLEFGKLGEYARGEFDGATIKLAESLWDAPEDTLIHEIQHAIQRAEGFASGASPEYWAARQKTKDAVGAYDQKIEQAFRQAEQILRSLPENVAEQFRDWYDLDKRDPAKAQQLADELSEGMYGDQFSEYYLATWALDDMQAGNYKRGANELYRNTAGEIEARDTASRRTMTPEQRRAARPDIGDDKTVFAEGGDWYAAASDAETSSIKEQIAAHQARLNAMDVVAAATVPTDLPNKDTAAKWAAEYLRPTGYKVDRQGYGEIYFSKKDIDKGLRYADTAEEKAALAVLPQVLKRGIEVGSHGQHKGREKQTITFAAPVELNGTRGNMAVVVNRHGSHYYAHRIVLPDGTAFRFSDEQNNAAQELSRGGAISGSLADTTSAASAGSITRNNEESKGGISERDGRDIRFSVDEDQEAEQKNQEKPKTAEAKTRRQKTKKPVAESLPIIAKRDLRTNLLNLFSIPEGRKAELGGIIDQYADRLLKNGELTQADRDAFFDRMYTEGVMTMPAEEYFSVGREAVKGGRVYVSESEKHEFGDDWNEFRKRAFANGIYLTSNQGDRGVDLWNMELAETLPGLFDAGNLDSRSILERIVQVAEEGKDQKLSLAEYAAELAGREYISEDEILDNMERQMDWALRTFAEKAKLEIHLRDRTGVKIAQEREKFSEAAQRQRERELVRQARERDERKAMQQRQREHRELRELQERTLKQLQWLSKNRWRAPEELQAAFDEVLGDIDIYAVGAANEMNWSRKYEATWKDLAQLYKTAKETDPNFLPSKELEKIVARLDGDKIADLDVDALQDLYRAAVGLRTEFYNRNNVINDELNRLFEEVYADSKREIETAPGGYKGKDLDKFMNLDQLTPMNVMQRMGGWNPQGAFYSMAKQLERGERDIRAYTVRANRRLEEFLTEYEDWVKKADGQGKDGIWYEVEVPELLELGMGDKPIFGPTIKVYMTPSQKVHMYLESKSYDNLRHMTGGRTFVDRDLYSQGKRQEAFAQGRTIRLAPETVKGLVANLTEEEAELARILEDYYNNFAKGEINRVSNILYGYDKAQSGNYAPIFTNRNYVKSEIGIFDTTAEGVGHLKARQFSKNPSYNISAFDAFERHVEQTARFVGMSIPARNWQTLLNWREKNNSMGDVITHKWGEESKKYIEDLLNRLQGGAAVERDTVGDFADKVLSNYISAVFGANPSIVLKQLGSIPLASAYLGGATFPSPAQIAQIDRDLIAKYTGDLAWRTMGYSTPETKHLKENPNWTETNKFTRFAFGGGAITAMDGWAASVLWPWAENKVRRDFPDLEVGTREQIDAGQSPFYKKVAEEFNEAVARSQSVSDEIHQGTLRKSRTPVTRAFTMFKSDSAQGYNALRQKIGEAKYYERSGDTENARRAKKAVGVTFVSLIGGYLWAGLVSFLIAMWKNKGKYYRDDEGELTFESVAKEMVMDLSGSLVGVVAGGEELMDILGNVLTGDTWYGIDTPGLEQLTDIIELLQKETTNGLDTLKGAADVVSNGGDLGEYLRRHGNDILGGIKELAEAVGTYIQGVPVSNLEAYILGGLKWISPELGTAYDDLMATAEKSGLSGLKGDALEQRVGSILSGRLNEIPEGAAAELAGLYEAGYTQAVPGDTPAKITVNGEGRDLGAYQQQVYETVWRESVAGALGRLLSEDWYQALDSASREKVLAKLYDYGTQRAKAALFDDFEPDSFVGKIGDFEAAGLSTVDYLEAWRKSAEIEDSGANASGRATEFAYWADTQGYTAEQAQVVKDSFTVFSHLPVEPERYSKLQEAGLSDSEAKELTEALADLEPLEGAASVSDMQRLRTIAAAGLDQETMQAAMGTVLGTEMTTESGGKSQYALMLEAMDAGYTVDEWLELKDAGYMTETAFSKVRISGEYDISPAQYIRYRELLLTADALNEDPAKRNNSIDQDEAAAAINGMLGLTNEQKAVLWQLQNKSWKANKNPFDSAVGQEVYDYLNTEALPSLGGGDLPSLSLPSLGG